MTTDQTTLREDLIAKIVVESLTQVPCDEDSNLPSWAYLAARKILTEFPELGQQPQTTLHVPASDLPPRFTPSDTHIRAGLVDIGQQPSIDPALRERIDHHINLVMNLRFEAGELYGKGEDWDPTKRQCDLAVKHLYSLIESIAPAAQPLPTRSQIRKHVGIFPTHRPEEFIDNLIKGGYAVEDEPDSQVGEGDAYGIALAKQICQMTELELSNWQDFCTIDELRALAKAVADRGEDAP